MVSAPGKAILMGEHAAVYGRPALVAAIDRRLFADFKAMASGRAGLELDLRDLGIVRQVGWDEILTYAERADRHFASFQAAPDAAHFADLRGEDPAHVVLIAVAAALVAAGAAPPASARLEIRSELPIGAGFGSSAATAVAVLAAVLNALGVSIDLERLEELALEVERRQHGTPSGVDGATVIRGGLLWVERRAGRLETTPVAGAAPGFFDRLKVFHSGRPAEATGDVVASVRALRARSPQSFERRLELMADTTARLRAALVAARSHWPEVVTLIRDFEAALEELGVVPAPVQAVIRRVEAEGGAAKISGAGSLAGPGAGSLLVFHPDPQAWKAWDFLRCFEALDLRLGAPGYGPSLSVGSLSVGGAR